MTYDPKLEFLPERSAVQRVNPEIRAGLLDAQHVSITRVFSSAAQFCTRILDDLNIKIGLPDSLISHPATDIADLSFTELRDFWMKLVLAAGTPKFGADIHAFNLAQRSQLVRAFDNPEAVLDWVTAKVVEIIGDLPRTARDIEIGRNPGDVLDPYILAANQALLYQNDFRQAIGATVAHKALMILEETLGTFA